MRSRHAGIQRVDLLIGAAALTGAFACAVLASRLGSIDAPNFFGNPVVSLTVLSAAALAVSAYALRPLWAGTDVAFAPRFVIALYFILLLLGAAALSALRLLAAEGYPIAATQRLPTVAQTIPAFTVGLLGGGCLIVGWLLGVAPSGLRRRSVRPVDLEDERIWSHLARVVPVLIAVGIAACALLAVRTGQIAIFAADIDITRFEQGAGLGFISLLQYELLLAACIAVCGLVLTTSRRRLWVLAIVVSIGALVVFRVERTPLLVVFLMALFVSVMAGKRVPRTVVLMFAVAAAATVGGLGLLRFTTASSLHDRREAIVRPLFDVAPEFREQIYVYQIYPQLHGGSYMASRDLAAIASSVVPSALLRTIGIEKSAVYTDVSREYSETMRILGYYPNNQKPLRVGLIGELYADFGFAGVGAGLALLGLALGRVPAVVRDSAHLLLVATAGVFGAIALVTPLPALLPIALVVIGTLVLVTRTIPGRPAG